MGGCSPGSWPIETCQAKEASMSTENSLVITKQGADNVVVVASNEVVGGQEAQKTVATAQKKTGDGAFSDKPTLGELVEFQITGLLVVFVVLGGITLLCGLMAKILAAIAPDAFYGKKKPTASPVAAPAPAAPAKPAPVAVAAPVAASVHPGLSDDRLLAILATVAQEVLGQSASVVKFRPMGAMDWTWSQQGRATHHSSHKL